MKSGKALKNAKLYLDFNNGNRLMKVDSKQSINQIHFGAKENGLSIHLNISCHILKRDIDW